MIDLTKLKSLIKKKVGNQTNFSNLIEEDKTTVSKVLNGKLKVSLEFADKTIRALNMNAKEIQEVFFATKIEDDKGDLKSENIQTKTRIYKRKH